LTEHPLRNQLALIGHFGSRPLLRRLGGMSTKIQPIRSATFESRFAGERALKHDWSLGHSAVMGGRISCVLVSCPRRGEGLFAGDRLKQTRRAGLRDFSLVVAPDRTWRQVESSLSVQRTATVYTWKSDGPTGPIARGVIPQAADCRLSPPAVQKNSG
jgi:hypothetical protein